MNLYQRLGVDPLCSMKDIKVALRAKLLKNHSDHGGARGAVRYIIECKKLKDPTNRLEIDYVFRVTGCHCSRGVSLKRLLRAQVRIDGARQTVTMHSGL